MIDICRAGFFFFNGIVIPQSYTPSSPRLVSQINGGVIMNRNYPDYFGGGGGGGRGGGGARSII